MQDRDAKGKVKQDKTMLLTASFQTMDPTDQTQTDAAFLKQQSLTNASSPSRIGRHTIQNPSYTQINYVRIQKIEQSN